MSIRIDDSIILKLFLDNPETEFHIREIAKLLHISPTSATDYLEGFRSRSLLTRRKERNHVLYKAKTDNKLYKFKKLSYNLFRLAPLIEYIETELNYPDAIILFGSYARAENTKESDIDIFILTESKRELNLDKKTPDNIEIFRFSRARFNELQQSNPELVNAIINGITVSGQLEIICNSLTSSRRGK